MADHGFPAPRARTWVGGLTYGQLGLGGACLLAGLAVLLILGASLLSAVLGIGVASLALVAVMWRPDGLTADRWLGSRLRRLVTFGRRTWVGPSGQTWPMKRDGTVLPVRLSDQRPHPAARGLAVWRHPWGDDVAGLLVDGASRTVTVYAALEPSGVDLADDLTRLRTRTGWTDLLRWVCHTQRSTGIVRLSWARHTRPAQASDDAPLARAVDDAISAVALTHTCVLAVTVDPARVRRLPQGRTPLAQGAKAACAALDDVVEQVRSRLPGWKVVDPLLSPGGVARLLRGCWQPDLDDRPVPAHAAWPRQVDVSDPARYATDGWQHRIWHVEDLPARHPSGDILHALSGSTVWPHTVACVMEPLDPRGSAEDAFGEATMTLGEREQEEAKGTRYRSERSRRVADALDREQDIANRHVEFALSLWVAVSAPAGGDGLEDAADDLGRSAIPEGVTLRPCWGQQDRAHLACVPTGRGVGRGR